MGDASASAQLHGMTARAGVDHLGFSSLYRGEATIGCGRVVDRGYVDRGRGVGASTRRNNNPTVEAWCAQVLNGVIFLLPHRPLTLILALFTLHSLSIQHILLYISQNDVLLLYPFREGEQYFQYDPVTHLATLQNDPAQAHLVSSATL